LAFSRNTRDEAGLVNKSMMKTRFYVVVGLWIDARGIEAFEAFERRAVAIMSRYEGRIEKAFRCSEADRAAGDPFEVHIVSFPNESAFQAYRDDEETRDLASLRAALIERTVIWRGEEIASDATQPVVSRDETTVDDL
jgi:hypothetical protein